MVCWRTVLLSWRAVTCEEMAVWALEKSENAEPVALARMVIACLCSARRTEMSTLALLQAAITSDSEGGGGAATRGRGVKAMARVTGGASMNIGEVIDGSYVVGGYGEVSEVWSRKARVVVSVRKSWRREM